MADDTSPASAEDRALVERLRAGDEPTFTLLVRTHHASLRRLARHFVSSDALAEEVAQECWGAILEGLASFEGRSSLKTWMFRILVNRAKTRGVREARSVPMSALGGGDDDDIPAVDPDRFQADGHWATPPARPDPERLLANSQLGAALTSALAQLPERQRQIVVLRDVEGWSSEEVCNILGLTETNQRVLLHRARSKLRKVLEETIGT